MPLVPTTLRPHLSHSLLQGKVGAELAYISQRQDTGCEGQKGDILMRHGDFRQDPVQCMATLNSLTYGEASEEINLDVGWTSGIA